MNEKIKVYNIGCPGNNYYANLGATKQKPLNTSYKNKRNAIT